MLYNLLIRFIVSVQRINILEGFGGTPEYLLHPPKEHLVEKVSTSFFFAIFFFLLVSCNLFVFTMPAGFNCYIN